jgi:hypothetical protein
VVTAKRKLRPVGDDAPPLRPFAVTSRAPKPIPAFEDRSEDLAPTALPANWGPTRSSVSTNGNSETARRSV